MTQFVAVSYSAGGRNYTHHNDGDPLEVGDKVEVETRHGHQRAIVEAITSEPSFPTKPVLRRLETAAQRAERKAAAEDGL